MRKILLCFMLLFVGLDAALFAQARRTSRTARTGKNRNVGNGFTFSRDAQDRIDAGCADVMKGAKAKKDSQLVSMCRVDAVQLQEADLGPWKKLVRAGEKIFAQLRRLMYVAAVFVVLWILAKAMYEGEMHWEHIGFLVIGVTLLAFAEVFIALAMNRVTLDDIKAGDLYVDCREPEVGLYACASDVEGSLDHDSKYIFPLKRGTDTSSTYKGLF